MLKIIIDGDNAEIRLTLKRVLRGSDKMEVIGEAEIGQKLIHMVEELDVIFLDIDMPNGIEVSKKKKQTQSSVK